MQKTFVISDHHFGHKPIIAFESRPFHDVDEMTATMIERWNAVVSPAFRHGECQINVSVEQWDYTPVSFEEIKRMTVPNEEQ